MKIQDYDRITLIPSGSPTDPIKILERPGSKLSRKQAYNLVVTILKDSEANVYNGTLTISSDSLSEIRGYEQRNNKKPFEIASKMILEERTLV